MAITAPVLALGIPIPNPTFARPELDTAGKAAGWAISDSASGALTGSALYDASPDRGHARVQRYTLAGTGAKTAIVLSSPAPPGMFCSNVSSYLTGFLLVKTSGLGASASLTLKVQWYNSSGTALTSPTTILTRATDASTWTVLQSTITVTPNPAADHLRISLVIARSSGSSAVTVDIAFASVGTYTSAAGYYTATRVLGSESRQRPTNKRSVVVDPAGVRRVLGRDRYVSPRVCTLHWPIVSDSERQVFDYLERMAYGRTWDGSTQNPGGGIWPLIVVTGLSGLPAIIMGDLMDEESGIAERQSGWRPDPPDWTVTFNLTERT